MDLAHQMADWMPAKRTADFVLSIIQFHLSVMKSPFAHGPFKLTVLVPNMV
jgi:hypothetical protein